MTGSDKVEMLVRSGDPGEWAPVGAALGSAFQHDPVFAWMIPDPSRRPAALRRYFTVEARHIALPHGTSVAAADGPEVVGAALVFPPGQWRMPFRVLARHGLSYLRVFAWRTPHAAGLLSAIERRHLRRPHYYVGYIGVVPQAQNHGLGRRLLEPIAQRCDTEGLPAYLEASSPDNVRLYERVGFESLAEIRPLGAPPLRLMVREPR